MPEGHTIHRLARDHKRLLGGHVVAASSPQGRFAAGAALIDGRVLEGTDAYGKHLFHRYAGAVWLHVHLGLIGHFLTGVGSPPAPRGALRLRLVGPGHWLDLRGPIACEIVTPADRAALIRRLGPDPLRRSADPERGWDRISRSRAPLGQLLMDQSVVAGVGNVYRAELLYRHRADPFLPGRDVGREQWLAMWADLVTLMRHGLRTGRIVTTRPADRPGSRRVRREDAHYVYRRAGEPCRVCGTPIATTPMAGRNLFWCPTCQAGG
ncbi:MAG: Fpg/Nei family DNA glycosylase [Actinomycetota bacterium]|nr:Fpg/Nei family DNA glycosylase [Actinomycetota bacterium]